jgi:hypothetical protein
MHQSCKASSIRSLKIDTFDLSTLHADRKRSGKKPTSVSLLNAESDEVLIKVPAAPRLEGSSWQHPRGCCHSGSSASGAKDPVGD